MKKKVLVTGATGFVGRYVVNRLQKNQYDVVVIVRSKKEIFDRAVQVIETDISDETMIPCVLEKIEKCDVIVHLAANLDSKDADGLISVNCKGTYYLITLAKRLMAEKFIYISSIPVIGIPKKIPITEEHIVQPQSLYHISKYMGENMVQTLCPPGMQKVILRIPSPIGVGMNKNNYLSFLLEKCCKNETIELFGQGKRMQNYIDVRDIAKVIEQTIEVHREGLFLIAGKRSVTNLELAFLCREVTGTLSKIIWGNREDPEERNQWIISTEKAEKQLGFSPQYELRDTIHWILDSMREKE